MGGQCLKGGVRGKRNLERGNSFWVVKYPCCSHECQRRREAKFLDDFDLKKVKISSRELKAAKVLVDEMTAKWKPDQYKDTYQDELLKYTKKKIKAGDVEENEEIEEEVWETDTNVIDLLPFLQKSLGEAYGHHKAKKTVKKKRASVVLGDASL